MSDKGTTKRVASWKHRNAYTSDSVDYRLLEVHVPYAKSTTYIVERDAKDTLGDPKWIEVHTFRTDDNRAEGTALRALVGLITQLLLKVETP